MKRKFKKSTPLLLVGLAAASVVLGLVLWLSSTNQPVSEISVKVVEIGQSGRGIWFVPKDAVAEKSVRPEPFVFRLKHLRTEQLAVEVAAEADGGLLLRSDELKSGDLLVLGPWTIPDGQAVAPTAGLDDGRLIRLTLEAGIAAAMAEDLEESVRFISTSYRDEWGYNIALMRKLLKRAYEEFDEARIEVAEPPAIQINGSRAVIQAAVRVTAVYQGHRNYLLGDQNTPNHILLRMERTASGWKMSEIKGLRPLGFEERFFRLLGAGVGLTMTAAERQEEQKVCMPCRETMTERFGLRR